MEPASRSYFVLPFYTLWNREVVRFFRQRDRIIGALGTPVLFWLAFGLGLMDSFQPPGATQNLNYLEYFYPGTLILILLFASVFGSISIIGDRKEGFLQAVSVAPVKLSAIVFGKLLGGTTIGLIQALLFLLLAFTLKIPLTLAAFLECAGTLFLIGLGLSGLGFCLAWKMESVAGFHAIMNLILMPLWLLSGALFPSPGSHSIMQWLMAINPLTYGLAAVRRAIYPASSAYIIGLPGMGISLLVVSAFAGMMFLATVRVASRRDRGTP